MCPISFFQFKSLLDHDHFVLVAAIAGFFPFNYHPAILYLGDTGALFIGFMISVLSLQGLKNATAVAVVTNDYPRVPITDTFLAIIRRTLSGQNFINRIAIAPPTSFSGLDTSGNCIGDLWNFDDFSPLISLLLNISSRIGGVLLVIGLLFGSRVVSRIDWGSGPTS